MALPAEVGENVSAMPHDPPAAIEAPEQASTLPGANGPPLTVARPKVIVTGEVFVKVTTPGDGLPVVGSTNPDCVDVMRDAAATEVPVRVEADTASPVLWMSCTTPSRVPVADGVKVTVAVHEAFRSVAQVVDATVKSLALAPVMTTAGEDRFQLTPGENGFVKVTVCGPEVFPGATVPKSTAAGLGVTS